MKVDLHPLSLEDVFHTRDESLSKADYHAKHLFLRILCHELGEADIPLLVPSSEAMPGQPPRTTESPLPISDAELERNFGDIQLDGDTLKGTELGSKRKRSRLSFREPTIQPQRKATVTARRSSTHQSFISKVEEVCILSSFVTRRPTIPFESLEHRCSSEAEDRIRCCGIIEK
jgi:hypothetical protein